ncbi:MAG TPA: DNA mismatch repair endonuclease MutL [Bdellovibrionota bacterium]|jgi:DNA mismatch repair protein MutL|nr:DNA mismatch repair endonuclease MutL [Bdellovibrionota bacterium]
MSDVVEAPKAVQVLSKEVIHRIAAGEVVDRPASVLKELIENSIDAGATQLKVTLIEGGLKAIIVEDNGIGMSAADLALCLQRHATSKIQNVDDLDKLFSLGFRGEALAAISSVSEIEIHTFRPASGAWTLKARGGLETYLGPGSQAHGTRVEVKDLFYNVPARKKFIKSTSAEGRACLDVLEHLALCFPHVDFAWYLLKETGDLIEDVELPATSLPERVRSVVGLATDPIHTADREHLPPGVKSLEIVFWGPPNFFPTQKHITLCVNGRAVFDKRLGYSLREAYYGVIPVGVFPAVHVQLEVDPEIIDANIHPQKKELRWPKGFSLAGLVYRQIRPHYELQRAKDAAASEAYREPLLFEAKPSPAQDYAEAAPHVVRSSAPTSAVASSPGMRAAMDTLNAPMDLELDEAFSEPTPAARETGFFASKRIVGEVGARWILLESENGMVVVDQHAAHERVNFERIVTKQDLIRSVPLLTPIPYRLGGGAFDPQVREQIMDSLEEFGFEFNRDDTVSRGELEIIAVPQADRQLKWGDWLKEIIEAAERDQEVLGLLDRIRTHVASSLACHSSVRFGQRLERDQIEALLRSMDEVQWGRYCPHGRPVYFEMTHGELEKRFDR